MIPVTFKPVDPDKPPFPKISFPKWILPEIKSRVEEHLEFMQTQKNIPIAAREMYDLYAYLVPIFNKIKNNCFFKIRNFSAICCYLICIKSIYIFLSGRWVIFN